MEVLPIKGNPFRTDFDVTLSGQDLITYDEKLGFMLFGGKF